MEAAIESCESKDVSKMQFALETADKAAVKDPLRAKQLVPTTYVVAKPSPHPHFSTQHGVGMSEDLSSGPVIVDVPWIFYLTDYLISSRLIEPTSRR